MRIGIIGAGNIGGALARHFVKAGHEVLLATRHPDKLDRLVKELGENACAGTVEEASTFGEVVVLAPPLKAITEIAPVIAPHVNGKVIIDAMNPYPSRDGKVAEDILNRGITEGQATQERFPDARVIRAFNTLYASDLRSKANRKGGRIAILISGDDAQAKDLVSRLIRDIGFEPYDLGRLAESKPQEPDGEFYTKAHTVDEIRSEMHVRR